MYIFMSLDKEITYVFHKQDLLCCIYQEFWCLLNFLHQLMHFYIQ